MSIYRAINLSPSTSCTSFSTLLKLYPSSFLSIYRPNFAFAVCLSTWLSIYHLIPPAPTLPSLSYLSYLPNYPYNYLPINLPLSIYNFCLSNCTFISIYLSFFAFFYSYLPTYLYFLTPSFPPYLPLLPIHSYLQLPHPSNLSTYISITTASLIPASFLLALLSNYPLIPVAYLIPRTYLPTCLYHFLILPSFNTYPPIYQSLYCLLCSH